VSATKWHDRDSEHSELGAYALHHSKVDSAANHSQSCKSTVKYGNSDKYNIVFPLQNNYPSSFDVAVESVDISSCMKATRNCVHSVFRSGDKAGINVLISEISGNYSSDKPEMRQENCWMMEVMIDKERKFGLPTTLHLISG
jgi:hypothetical protein